MYVCVVDEELIRASGRVSNEVRTARARDRLVDATLGALIDVGFIATTQVEICARAGLTRGALNYHFPSYERLLAVALGVAIDRLLDFPPTPPVEGPVERWVYQAASCIERPEFKAVLELWLAARNDPELGEALSETIAQVAELFDPSMVLQEHGDSADATAVYRTIAEAFIGLGLGRAVGGGALPHEPAVLGVLLDLARDLDQRIATPKSTQ